NTVRCGDEATLTRAHAMFVNHGNHGVEGNLAEAERQMARPGLDVDLLRAPIEALCGHVQLVSPRLDVICGERCRPDELSVDEDLRLGDVGVDSKRAGRGRGAVGAGAAAGLSGSTLVRLDLRITSRPITNAKQNVATARTRRFTCRF